jgi:hypothetical protein
MEPKERKITLDVLVEGPGGELVFRPVQASKSDLKEVLEASKNPVLKHNVFRAGTEKKVKL